MSDQSAKTQAQAAAGAASTAAGNQTVQSCPHSAKSHEDYKAELRRQMQKPPVKDPKLKEVVDANYRENAKIGSGSTADAIRHEKATGELVGGRNHTQKGKDTIAFLKKWQEKNPEATPGDRAAAENMIKDLEDALFS